MRELKLLDDLAGLLDLPDARLAVPRGRREQLGRWTKGHPGDRVRRSLLDNNVERQGRAAVIALRSPVAARRGAVAARRVHLSPSDVGAPARGTLHDS